MKWGKSGKISPLKAKGKGCGKGAPFSNPKSFLAFQLQKPLTPSLVNHWNKLTNGGAKGFERVKIGRQGHDYLIGTNKVDLLIGRGGDDWLAGKGGNDYLLGGSGSDRLWGGRGNDWLYGGSGSDEIRGGEGIDVAFYFGFSWQYKVEKINGSTVVSRLCSDDETDQLSSIEFIQFLDKKVEVEQNSPPIAQTSQINVQEDSPTSGFLIASDADGDDLVFRLVSGTANGSLTILEDGTFTFDPEGAFESLKVGETATETFTYSVSDGSETVEKTATITVTGSNDGPVVDQGLTDQTVAEESSFNFAIPSDAFSDVDGDALTYSAELAGGGALPSWLNFDGTTFRGTPDDPDVGTVTVAVTADDGNGGTLTEAFTLDVTPVNDSPVVSGLVDLGSVAEDAPITVTTAQLLANASDGDGDTLTVSGVTLSSGSGSVTDNGDGSWTVTPSADWSGSLELSYDVSDGTVTVAGTAGVTVTPVNDAPVVSGPASDTVSEDAGAYTFTALQLLANATDVDGDTLTINSVVRTDGGRALTVTIGADGAISFDPNAFNDLGVGESEVLTFSYNVNDGSVDVPSTVSITVTGANDGPTIDQSIADQTAAEESVFSFAIPGDAFSDVDGDALIYSATLAGGGALPSWLSFDGTTFTGTPDDPDVGVITLEVTADDGHVGTMTETFTLDVTAVNDAPVAGTSLTAAALLTYDAYSYTLPAGAFTDVDGDALTLTATLSNGDPLPSWLTFDGTTFTGTPTDGDLDSLLIKVTAADPSGATAEQTFTLDVSNVREGTAGDDTINGTVGIDTLIGQAGADSLNGGAGNDTLEGGIGADSLFGGSGNDVLDGGADADFFWADSGDDTLLGGDGNDILYGAAGADVLDGGQGDDRLYVDGDDTSASGGDGYDRLYVQGAAGVSLAFGDIEEVVGGSGNDTFDGSSGTANQIMYGRAGNDTLSGGAGNDYLRGEDDNDIISGGGGADRLYGDGGDDTLAGGAGADTLNAGAGNDTIAGLSDGDTIDGGAGEDWIDYSGLASGMVVDLGQTYGTDGTVTDTLWNLEHVIGTVFADVLSGNASGNTLIAGAGDDTLSGALGDDYLQGGAGADRIYAGADNDILDGGAEDDFLWADEGDDTLLGGDGNDTLFGSAGADVIHGGDGNDDLYVDGDDTSVSGGAGYDRLFVQGAAGAHLTVGDIEEIVGEAGDDAFDGASGSDNQTQYGRAGNDTLTGGSGNDYLRGEGDNDILTGNDGIDRLYGDAGNDTLSGGSGADTLDAGTGEDILSGGAGADTLNGGDGTDWADFTSDGAGVTANITTYSAIDGSGATDTLWNIENLRGSAFNDSLIGNNGVNQLSGGDGDDRLEGYGGNDVLEGESGTDLLYGGGGDDSMSGGTGNDSLYGGSGADTMDGGVDNDFFWGDSGADTLIGGDGDDILYGANDADDITGGAGNDRMVGGAGDDTYHFDRGEGQDALDNRGESSSNDVLSFGASVDHDQLWFRQFGNNLVVNVIGTTDQITVEDWYNGTDNRLASFSATADGQTLSRSNVQNLVDAMASFSPPAFGETELDTEEYATVLTQIATNWQTSS